MFSTMKSKISSLERGYKISGHHSSGIELNQEIFDNFINIGKTGNKDYALYYCWLEWHDSLEHCAWLSRSDKSGDAGNEDNPKKRSKKKKNDALYVVLDQVKSTMSLISETNERENTIETMELLANIIKCPLSSSEMIMEATVKLQQIKEKALKMVQI
jgi:hypothetical protein